MSETATQSTRPLLGTKIGVVISDKRDKARTVSVPFTVKHPKYGKYIKRNQKFHVHDGENVSKEGDRVQIARCRPLSKTISWRLVRVVEEALPPVTSTAVPAPEIAQPEEAPPQEQTAE